MMRSNAYDIIHATNYAALCIAILRPSPTTVEDAFELYERTPERGERGAWHRIGINHRERMQEMADLREAGWSWSDIGQALGLKAPQCYFSRHKRFLNGRLIDFSEVRI